MEYLDFWSKYQATLNDNRKALKYNNQAARENHSQALIRDTEDSKDVSIDEVDENEQESGLLNTRKLSKRLSKKKKSYKKGKKRSQLNHVANSKQNESQIQKIQIYYNELEKNFDLAETLKTFNLQIGKSKKEMSKPSFEHSQFKGNFMLYDEANLNFNLKSTLDIKGGFLRNLPTNLPIKVKVHVYIIKFMIMNAMSFIGKAQPKICLNFGANEIKYENVKCSVETMVGKCFEFEARFPNDAQLMISLCGGGIVPGWNDLIGQTMIDLEDRFYSNLYATCGLPKKVNAQVVKKILKFLKKFWLFSKVWNNGL